MLLSFLRFTAFVLLAPLLAAQQAAPLQPQGYVSDFAGVIDSPARADLEKYCTAVERATGAQMAFVTINSLGENDDLENFANDLYRRWGIGQKGKDEGLLLLLVVRDRHSRLEVGRGLEPIITDGTSGALLREMRPALRSGDYAAALGTAAHSLGQRLAAAKGVTIDDSAPPARRVPDDSGDELPWPVIAFLVFLVLSFLMSRRRGGGGRWRGGGGGFLPGLILGNMMSRPTYGGYGGGGFGGYDSGGGGFGGFGGGDSGGGGASSDW